MNIVEKKVKIRDLVNGYINNEEEGVSGYGKMLDIRPPFQREFIYKDHQRDDVIRTILKGFPLNVFYWSKSPDGTYELLDGQQRTISICSFYANDFSVTLDGKPYNFDNLPSDKKEDFLNYELAIYECDGKPSEKTEWFKVINIAGEKLKNQELLNAVYVGPFVSEAKKKFSKSSAPAVLDGIGDLVNGHLNRQDILETALDWISNKEGVSIEDYMAKHQNDSDAEELWNYWQEVFGRVKRVFPSYKDSDKAKLMKGLEWGKFYNKYKDNKYNAKELETRINDLIEDDEVSNKKGIYEYLLSGEEKFLQIRAFPEKIKVKVYNQQGGICKNPDCPKKGKKLDIKEMQADHIVPWTRGGKTTEDNCHMLCEHCNKVKHDN